MSGAGAAILSEARAPVADVRDLRLRYKNGVEPLRGVDLVVHAGEHVAILGASGAGKTTLLRCLAQRLAGAGGATSTGDVTTRGRVATIHQDLRLVRRCSALRNVLHGCVARTPGLLAALRPPAHERARAMALLAEVGVQHRALAPVHKLSGGEQQRVAVARALMHQPSLLLADEPVANLDHENAHRTLALLRNLCRTHDVALVTVLHDPELARRYADRVVRLHEGRLWQDEPCVGAHARTDADAHERCAVCSAPVPGLRAPASTAGTPATITIAGTPALAPGEPRRAGRVWWFVLGAIGALLLYAWALAGLDVRAQQLARAGPGLVAFVRDALPRDAGELARLPWGTLLAALAQTVQMALVGTTLGVLLSIVPAVLAARSIGPRWMVAIARFVLSIVRTVPALVWALIMVAALGFGPLAGVAALAAYSVGYLTKFFYETLESADAGPQDALRELGASRGQRLLLAALPLAAPMLLSSCVFVLEYNVRAATILGIVDAGGIGWHIKHYLDYRNFPAALACLALMLVVVVALDAASGRLRRWALGA